MLPNKKLLCKLFPTLFFLVALIYQLKVFAFDPPDCSDNYTVNVNYPTVVEITASASDIVKILQQSDLNRDKRDQTDFYLGSSSITVVSNSTVSFRINLVLGGTSTPTRNVISGGIDNQRFKATHETFKDKSVILKVFSNKTATGADTRTEIKYEDSIIYAPSATISEAFTRTLSVSSKGGQLFNATDGFYHLTFRVILEAL